MLSFACSLGIAAAAVAVPSVAHANPNPIDWRVFDMYTFSFGIPMPLRYGQHDNGDEDGFGKYHIEDGHGIVPPHQDIQETINLPAPACVTKQNLRHVCVNEDLALVVVFTENFAGAWLRANAALLRTIDPDDDDFSDLEPLRAIVGDARVVAIGESTHRIHEFYQIRHRLTRFLVAELGFTAFVMESGFPEGLAVDSWIRGGAGDVARGITYNMGRCTEMSAQLDWFRARQVRFYGMDLSDSSASALPSISLVVDYLDRVDPAYAESVRTRLLPMFGYLPADRTGLAWAAPALRAYMGLEPAVRYEMTARIGALAERMQAMRIVYIGRSDPESYAVAYRCAVTGRHTDAFLQIFALGEERTYEGANIRDAAMAENVEWILGREERIVIGAANGHVQRWPFSTPPIVNNRLTMLGEQLASSLGDQLVVVATCFGGGELFLHEPLVNGPPGHTRTFVEEMPPLAEASLDELLAAAGMPRYLVDLRRVPGSGPVAERFAAATCIMTGSQPTPINPLAAFDAVVYVDTVSPWHHLLDEKP